MKELSNKQTKIIDENKSNIYYSDLIRIVVGNISGDGLTIAEMKQRMKIIDVCAAARKKKNEALKFEDEDFKLIKSKVEAHRWGVINKEIIQFSDDVQAVK